MIEGPRVCSQAWMHGVLRHFKCTTEASWAHLRPKIIQDGPEWPRDKDQMVPSKGPVGPKQDQNRPKKDRKDRKALRTVRTETKGTVRTETVRALRTLRP